jgi:hypothetical protein
MTKVKITPARQLVDRSAGILRVERKMNKATIITKRGQRGPSGASVVSLSNPVHKVARAGARNVWRPETLQEAVRRLRQSFRRRALPRRDM